MKERGIIMSGQNPTLILEDSKNQTRRIALVPSWARDRVEKVGPWFHFYGTHPKGRCEHKKCCHFEGQSFFTLRCPHGVAGDRLWMREAFKIKSFEQVGVPRVAESLFRLFGYYRDGVCFDALLTREESIKFRLWKRKTGNIPSIFMFRSLSRALMDLLDVKAEILQDISEVDAKAEGMKNRHDVFHDSIQSAIDNVYRRNYAALWDNLHGKGAWKFNPWVWALTTKRVIEL